MIEVARESLDFLWPIQWIGLHRNYLNDGEMEIIAALLRTVDAKSMIEFGCRDGRTARVLLHNVSSLQRYVGIDVPISYQPALAHQRSEMVVAPGALMVDDARFELLVSEHGSLDLVADDFPERFDAAFIDGDHSERVVTHDSELARAVVKPEGVIVWHDYNQSPHVDVTRVVDGLCAKGWPIEHVAGSWIAYCRV